MANSKSFPRMSYLLTQRQEPDFSSLFTRKFHPSQDSVGERIRVTVFTVSCSAPWPTRREGEIVANNGRKIEELETKVLVPSLASCGLGQVSGPGWASALWSWNWELCARHCPCHYGMHKNIRKISASGSLHPTH